MNTRRTLALSIPVLALFLASPAVHARDKTPGRITVSFGTGLNNSGPGNTPNHHIVPQEFKVRITSAKKLDGTVVVVPATVNFIVAGFHWVWVYQPGVDLDDLPRPTAGTFVNFEVLTAGVSNVFAKGVFPGTPALGFSDIAPANPVLSAAQNRTDSFAFTTPGTYLVICNVRGHFLDGMYAWIKVLAEEEEDDDNDAARP